MKRYFFIICFAGFLLNTPIITPAQNVGIGTAHPNPSAALDIQSNSKGILTPRLTLAQKAGIASPATGLLIYQTEAPEGFYYNKGLPATPEWVLVSSLPLNATLNQHTPLVNLKNTGYGNVMKLEIENSTSSANALEVRTNSSGSGGGLYVSKGLSGIDLPIRGAITAEAANSSIAIAGYSESGYGLYGLSFGQHGVAGESHGFAKAGIFGKTNLDGGYGVFGQGVGAGTGGYFHSETGRALITNGKLQINNTGESAGKVLMTNSTGSADWEGGIAFAANAINNSLTVAHATNVKVPFYFTNYNLGNSYRTISSLIDPNIFIVPVKGIYHFDAALIWEAFSNGSGSAFLNLVVNGDIVFSSRQSSATNRQTTMLSCDVLLNAGEKVTITAYQTSGVPQTIPNALGNYFNGRFVMKN